MWQNYVFAIGAWIFIIALIPSLNSVHKPAIWTSFMTALILTIYAYCFMTLGMMVASISTAGTAVCWWTLFYQKVRRGNVG